MVTLVVIIMYIMNKEKVCFVISPIGDEDSDTRKRSDLTYEYIIRPVVEEFGYDLIRADHINEPGIITSQIIDKIVESSLVIADLSDNNPNVFYELAIRHAIKKPYIQMVRHGQNIPFDITGLRTIFFEIDLESANNAKKELFNQVESIETGQFNTNNPITSAIHQSSIQKMLTNIEDIKSDNVSKIVIESVSELSSIVMDLRADIHTLKSSKGKTEINATQDQNMIYKLDLEIFDIQGRINKLDTIISKKIDPNNLTKIIKKNDALIEIKNLNNLLSNLMRKRDELLKSHY